MGIMSTIKANITCKNVTLAILMVVISIIVLVPYNMYQKTTFYYPDQHWALIDSIPVWSADHPHTIITTTPSVPLIHDDYLSKNETNIFGFNHLGLDQSLQTQSDRATITDPITKSPIPVLSQQNFTNPMPNEFSLMPKLAKVQSWDRRTYFVGFWNYSFYDTITQSTIVLLYLYQRFPESLQRPPETHVGFVGMSKHGQIIYSANLVVESKNVLMDDASNIYYNATTHWEARHGYKTITDTEKAPKKTITGEDGRRVEVELPLDDKKWSFSHVMDAKHNIVQMQGHFPTKYNCDWDHPDRLNPKLEGFVDVLDKLRAYRTEKNDNEPNYRADLDDLDSFINDKIDQTNNGATTTKTTTTTTTTGAQNTHNTLKFNTKTSGNFTSTEPIDIDAFIRQHTYDRFVEKQSAAERLHSPGGQRQNYTCASMITYNFTLFPTSQGFGNYDMLTPDKDDVIPYTTFIEEYVNAYEMKNKTKQEEFMSRKIPDDKVYSSCGNGFSFVHAYGSVADGFITVSPLYNIDTGIISEPELYLYKPQQHQDDISIDGLPMEDINYQNSQDSTKNDQIIRNKFNRDYRINGNCGEQIQSGCINLPLTQHQQVILSANVGDSYRKHVFPKIHKMKGYRYGTFYDSTLSTLTPNTITFWSHALHARVPSLRQYLIASEQLNGPSPSAVKVILDKFNIPSLSQHNNNPLVIKALEQLEEDRIWNITLYLNRFKWYGGSSYGCCLTRGTPSYRYPWAWIQVTHAFSQYDQVYVFGVPARLKPTGEYVLNESILSQINNPELKQLIINEARRLSFSRNYDHIIKLAQDPKYNDINTPVPPALEQYDPITGQSLGHYYPLRYQSYNDLNLIYGDARLHTSTNSLGTIYGAYTLAKFPQHPQLTTRQVLLREDTSWHPSHPWNIDKIDEPRVINDYSKINPETLKFEQTDNFINTHYISSIPSHLQQPIPPATTYPSYMHEYNNNVNGIVDNVLHQLRNVKMVQSSTDGHLSLFNLTMSKYYLYQDSLGSVYMPLQRHFVQETRQWWICTHASTVKRNPLVWEPEQGSTMRMTVPMWQDIGQARVKEDQNKMLKHLESVEVFISKVKAQLIDGKKLLPQQQQQDKAMVHPIIDIITNLPPALRALLLHQHDIVRVTVTKGISYDDGEKLETKLLKLFNGIVLEIKETINAIDGDLTVYTDMRSDAHSSVLMYKKHYLPGVNCNDWYNNIGKELITNTSVNNYQNQNNIEQNNNKVNNDKNDIPLTCPLPGEYQYTIWCQDYNNTKLTKDGMKSNRNNDELDLFNLSTFSSSSLTPTSKTDDICVIYTKHLYVPKATQSLLEHAFESDMAIDKTYLLAKQSQFNNAGLRYEYFNNLFSEINDLIN